MTSAAAVFCSVVALAFVEGFGSPAFVRSILSDAMSATLPLLVAFALARFAMRRLPAHTALVVRVHTAAQGLLVAMAFAWWWIEPHHVLTQMSGGSLPAMFFEAIAGAAAGFVLALLAERASSPLVLRETVLAASVVFLVLGGWTYRVFDHVEAGARVAAGTAILSGFSALAAACYLVLRGHERAASAIPALAPAVACAALLAASGASGPQALSERDSVVVVVVDTLRADIAGGTMPDLPGAMPQLARMAGEGVRFTQAVSPAPWTLPATVSLLSGWNPHRHRFGASASLVEVTRGDPQAMYLAGALRDAGYLTASFVNNPYLRPWFGFDRGYYTMRPYHGRALDGAALALEWLREHAGAPSFAFVHIMDPHWPYEAPPGFGAERRACAVCDSLYEVQYRGTSPEDRAEIRRRYGAEVSYADAVLGRFYDTLAAAGVLDHSWLVVTADHGEEFWEHGKALHGHSLYDELLRVPLVVVPPRALTNARRGERIDAQVRLEDVAATVLDVAGLDAGLARDGKSLLPLLAGKPEADQRVSVAGYMKVPEDMSYSVRRPPWKVINSPHATLARLYALDRDPGEIFGLPFGQGIPATQGLENWKLLRSLLEEPARLGLNPMRVPVAATGATPDADTQSALRSLGYLQ